MTLDAVLSAIEAHAAAAGAAVTPPITDVCAGLPVPRGRCVRVFWTGEAEPVRMPGRYTLSGELVGDSITVRGFWPVASADEAAHRSRVLEMAALAHGVRAAIDGDQTLDGDAADSVLVGDSDADFAVIAGALYAVVDIPLTVSYREVEITR